jgi:hypothetical protein
VRNPVNIPEGDRYSKEHADQQKRWRGIQQLVEQPADKGTTRRTGDQFG